MALSKIQSESIDLADNFAGMRFGGTASGNALNDYEEGLHSPTVTPDSGSVTLNTSHTKVSYVKIGDYVTVNGHLVIASSSSATGRLLVSLPFTPADLDLTAGRGALPIVVTGTGSNVNNFCAFYGEGVAAIDIRKANVTGVSSTSANELNGNDDIYFQVSFRTS